MAEEKNTAPVEAEETDGLDLGVIIHDMVRGFLKYWYIVLALVLVMGLKGMYDSVSGYVPYYRCQASFTVVAPESDNDSYTSSPYYDRSAVSQMVATFPHLLNTDLLRERIREDLGRNYSASVRPSSLAESNLFTLTVTSWDPQEAYDVLVAVVNNYPEVSAMVMGEVQLNMIDPPRLPTEPFNQMSWVGATYRKAVMGLMMGVALLAVYALTRNTARRDKDIEGKLNQQCLAVIPQVQFKKRTGKVDTTISIFNEKTGVAFQESFRGLSLRLVGTMQEKDHKVLGVTGTVAGEGSTVIARNIAMALAESRKKVLYIDASFQPVKDKNGRPGLDSYLEGSCELADILIRDHKAHIYTITCRRRVPPAELAKYTQQLQALILGARNVMDYVIVDIPPCENLSDAAIGVELCEALVYVIRQDNVKMGKLMDTVEDLSRYEPELYGCILNGAQSGLAGYGYGYGYNYSRYSYSRYGRYGYGRYGYGYGYGERKKKS